MSNVIIDTAMKNDIEAIVDEARTRGIELSPDFYLRGMPRDPQPYAVVTVCADDDNTLTIHTEEPADSSVRTLATPASMSVNPTNYDALARLRQELNNLERSAYCQDMSAWRYQARHKALGCKVSNILFGSPDNELFRILEDLLARSKEQNGYIRIVLNLPFGELHKLPWEYALGPDDYPLGVHPRLTVVRMPGCSGDASAPVSAAEPPFDITLVCAEGGNDRNMRDKIVVEVPEVVDIIHNNLKKLDNNTRVNRYHSSELIVSQPLDIFYYIGHGAASRVGWDFGSGRREITADELIKLVSRNNEIAVPRLSVLLTCAGQGYSMATIDNGMRYADVLVTRGAPAVLAIFGTLDVNVAPLLVNSLHFNMVGQYPLDWVLQQVRRHVYKLEMSENGDCYEANNWYRFVLSTASPQALDALAGYGATRDSSPLLQALIAEVARNKNLEDIVIKKSAQKESSLLADIVIEKSANARRWRDARELVFQGVSRDSIAARLDALEPLVASSTLAAKLVKVRSALADPDTLEGWRDLKWSVAAEAIVQGAPLD